MAGTMAPILYFRALGATIGSDVTLESVSIADPAMVTIGNHARVERGSRIATSAVLGDTLVIDPVHICDETVVGHGAVVERGVTLGVCAELSALSTAFAYQSLDGGYAYTGVPAVSVGPAQCALWPRRTVWSRLRTTFFFVSQLLSGYVSLGIMALAGYGSAYALLEMYSTQFTVPDGLRDILPTSPVILT